MKIQVIYDPHQSDERPEVSTKEFDGTLFEFVSEYFECTPEEMDGWDFEIRTEDEIHIWSDDDFWFEVIG